MFKMFGIKRLGYYLSLLLAVVIFAMPQPSLAEVRNPPYWVSIAAGQARMRTGPGRSFPATWLYQRRDLPVRVLEIYPNWRKVEDPDGAKGWIQSNLLSEKRTAMVRGGVAAMREAPNPSAKILWRAAPGVIGRVTKCQPSYCEFDVLGKIGYVEIASLWGITPGEAID